MPEWIYIIHPPRENFARTMTPVEEEVWSRHWQRAKRLYLEGSIIVMGPSLGSNNLGICIFEAPDEAAAQQAHGRGPSHLVGRGPRRAAALSRLAAAWSR